MTAAARLAVAGIVRAPARTVLRVAALALATALLGAILLFIGSSLRTMTGSAVRAVPLDWQGPVASERQALSTAATVARQPGVLGASAAATAPFARAQHEASSGAVETGKGAVLALRPSPARDARTFRMLRGSLREGAVVLDQQLAATLQAQVGNRIALTPRKGAKPRTYRVSGVALVTAADQLFQPLDPRLGPAPAQPPALIAIMSLQTFGRTFAPALPAIGPASVASSAVPGAQRGVQWQVHAQVDPAGLGSSPSEALKREAQRRNTVERVLLGRVQLVDNLGDALTTATGDALYAEALYVMLAVPGALVALGLAYFAALGTAGRDRRSLVLLRTRGASRRLVVWLAVLESLGLGLLGGIAGAALALAALAVLVPGGVHLTAVTALVTLAACVAIAFGGALAARIVAGAGAFSGEVAEAARQGEREQKPLWQRLYVDVAALALSGLIWWLTARTGFSAVVIPDSNPTLSLSIYMFFGPALLWIGATLLLVRLRGRALARVAAGVAGRRPASALSFVLASAGRRGGPINRGLVLVGLLLAFGVELGLFTATYDAQARVDAQLTLGADVVATAPSGVVAKDHLVQRVAAVRGVQAVSPVDHSYAYIGSDLQDTYGVDPATLGKATRLRDSYFLGGTASEMLARLRARPDAILVSRETITDYSLAQGDIVRLRVLDTSTGRFRVVSFHVAGTVQEFPSAPKDSFMVVNLDYLSKAARDGGPNVVFAKASGDPVAAARRVAAATASAGTTVRNIREQTAQTVSSITTVDLTGIARIESAFAVILAAAAMGLFVALGVSERRVELATMAAIGATLREIAGFLWFEAGLVLGAALALAAVLGWVLAQMLVAMLRHVFDPPPDALTVPWTFLAALVVAAVGTTVVASALSLRGLGRLRLGAILREP